MAPKSAAGKVTHKHATWDNLCADLWVRVHLSSNDGVSALGVYRDWDTENEDECAARLERRAFVGVGGRAQNICARPRLSPRRSPGVVDTSRLSSFSCTTPDSGFCGDFPLVTRLMDAALPATRDCISAIRRGICW